MSINVVFLSFTTICHVYKCHSPLCSITIKLLSTYCPTGNALGGDDESGGSGGSTSSSSCVSSVSTTMYGVGGAWGWGILVLLSLPSFSSNTFHLSCDRASNLGGKLEKHTTFTLYFQVLSADWYFGDHIDPFFRSSSRS